MKASDLRELSVEQLVAKADELRSEYFSAKVRHSTGQLETASRLKALRRDAARVETILREKREAQP